MGVGSSTTDVAMINLIMLAADGSGGVWQDPVQLIPHGMNGDPEGFVARIRDGLPLVNNLRILFNEHSFNADGSLHPQMERFLAAAVAQGFDLTICYGEGDAQNIGIGSGPWPSLTNAEAFAALQDNLSDVAGAWDSMLAWMEAHREVAAGVWGWEVMNESAAYRHSIRNNGAGDGLTAADFVRLYADHTIALSQMIDARMDGHILAGGWGYNGDFLTLRDTMLDGQSALDYLRAGIGPDLVWSAHLYPGWMGTNQAASPADLLARLAEVYAPVAGDAVLITEINADGQIDDPAQAQAYDDFYAASYDWFADQGIGLGWFPGLQTGASHLLYLETNGTQTYRHQHSLAHALNGFSLGRAPASEAGSEVVQVALVTARLRNESYQIAAGEADYDPVSQAGFGFGYQGADTVTGTHRSNDFLYGGGGDDVLQGFGADDFLFGQAGHDLLQGGDEIDTLFGGRGKDRLDGGAGSDYMAGGQSDDVYIVTDAGDVVVEHAAEGRDLVQTTLAAYGLAANVEHLAYLGTGRFAATGNALHNRISGGAMADSLSGLQGRDTLEGGAGADVLSGGGGRDTAAYDGAAAGVRADLAAVQTGPLAGDAAGDRFASVENLRGSNFDDQLSGDAGANVLWGMAGDDVLAGRGGKDQIFGGAGADSFVFGLGDGADRLRDFQDDVDTLVLGGLATGTDLSDVLALAYQQGAGVRLVLGGGDSVLIANISLAALADDLVIL
jgi:Ca2+-binding RTX toxin-like protein